MRMLDVTTPLLSSVWTLLAHASAVSLSALHVVYKGLLRNTIFESCQPVQVSALAALTALEELSLARNCLGSACTFGIAGAAAAAAALAGDSGQGPGSMALSCNVALPGAGAAILPALTRLCLADNSLASLPALQLRSLTRTRTLQKCVMRKMPSDWPYPLHLVACALVKQGVRGTRCLYTAHA